MAGQNKNPKSINDITIGITMVLSLALGLLIFKGVPLLTTNLVMKWTESQIILGVVEGVIKFGMFLGYIILISQMKEIRRVFEYHGAEHTVINTFEHGMELTPENFAKHTTIHPRCGTSFILVVIIVSIIVYCFIPFKWHFVTKLVLRLILLAPIAGISYEIIKFAGRHRESKILSLLLSPGLLIQRITTRPPSEDQIEVAYKALDAVMEMEKKGETCTTGEEDV